MKKLHPKVICIHAYILSGFISAQPASEHSEFGIKKGIIWFSLICKITMIDYLNDYNKK